MQARDDVSRDVSRLDQEGRALVDVLRLTLDRIGVEQRELDSFDERQRGLQLSVGEAEGRMETLLAKERGLAVLHQRLDEMYQSVQGLHSNADDLARKQADLDGLRGRLADVDELSLKTAVQAEALAGTRQDLVNLGVEITEFHKAHVDAAQLRDKLGADRTALEGFASRMGDFLTRAPEIEASVSGVTARLNLVEAGLTQADRLGEMVRGLEAQLARVSARSEFVDRLEGRIGELQVLSADVDRRMADQLGRRMELDAVKTQADSVGMQMLDVAQKVEAVAAAQARLLPVVDRLGSLEAQLVQSEQHLATLKRDDTAVREQAIAVAALLEQGRRLATETGVRSQELSTLAAELARSAAVKDELVEELTRTQSRQREAVAQVAATEDQLKRADVMFRQLEQRRSQVAFSERKVAAVEARVAELAQASADVDQRLRGIAERETVVAAVRREVEAVHDISAKSREDLDYLAEQRDDVTRLRAQVQQLLDTASETQEKIAAIESRRRAVDEVQSKASMTANLLADVRLNLDALTEQKAVVDHVAEQIAGIQFVSQEATGLLRALQQEREMAQRIATSL